MRALAVSLLLVLATAACAGGSSASSTAPEIDYQVDLVGTATANGSLVLNSPDTLKVPVAPGQTAVDVALALRSQLQEKGYTVLCTLDRGNLGFSVLVQGRVQLSSDSDLGGISGGASQVIQRGQGIASVIRTYFNALASNDANTVHQVTADSFYNQAGLESGKGIRLIGMNPPSIGCYSSSVVVEVALQSGQHDQRELHLSSDQMAVWKVDSSTVLASWGVKASSNQSTSVGTLDRVAIMPTNASVAPGGNLQFTAQGYDSNNNPIPNLPYAWTANGGGSITATGLYTASPAPGTYPNAVQVTAIQGGNVRAAFTTVVVGANIGALDHVVVTPSSISLTPGGSVQFTAQGYDANNNPIPNLPYVWTAANSSRPVTAAGFFTAGAASGTYPNAVQVTTVQGSIARAAVATVVVKAPGA